VRSSEAEVIVLMDGCGIGDIGGRVIRINIDGMLEEMEM